MARKRSHIKQNPSMSKPLTPKLATVDIVIPVYQRFDLLAECLSAIPEAAGKFSYRIIIVDNGSPKDIADNFYSEINDPNIKIIRNAENMGFPRAINQGYSRGFSTLVFFLNDDVIMYPNSLEHMIEEMQNDKKLGIVGMKLFFPETTDLRQDAHNRPPGKIQHVGLATNIRADVVHNFIGWSKDNPKVLAVKDVYAVTGAAMLTRRTLFHEAGKFLEVYGLGTYEDVDFCLTVRKLGYNIIVDQEAVGIHYTGATAETHKINYPMNNNRMIFLQRWQNEIEWSDWWNL